MSESKPSPSPGHRTVNLHVWPNHGDLLSFDVASIAALLFLQLTIPGQFSLSYCANPDLSPSGQLPYITHGLHHASGLSSIFAYVRKLPNARNPDTGLNASQVAQLTARIAHVESTYGDLVNHMLYSLQENWSSVTRPALVSMLPVPQCYYVPSRIRGSYKARLEASELWHVPEVEDEPEEPRSVLGRRKKQRADDKPHKYKSVLEREKVVEKTRSFFDVYDRLLGEQTFFMGGQTPSTLDVVFAAHTHVLLSLKFPDPLVVSVLAESYSRFISHRDTVLSMALPDQRLFPPVAQKSWSSSLRYIVPWPRKPVQRRASAAFANSPEVKKLEWRYKLWRWGFIGASVLAAAAYLHFATIVILIPNQGGPARL
ncbi:Tom37 C-terminal domain-containing protein, partial [Earliella scabrosa]